MRERAAASTIGHHSKSIHIFPSQQIPCFIFWDFDCESQIRRYGIHVHLTASIADLAICWGSVLVGGFLGATARGDWLPTGGKNPKRPTPTRVKHMVRTERQLRHHGLRVSMARALPQTRHHFLSIAKTGSFTGHEEEMVCGCRCRFHHTDCTRDLRRVAGGFFPTALQQ